MATFSQSTIDKGSDIFQDFLCSTCEDKKLNITADFYCESCVKFYCGKCIGMHSQLFTKHTPYGREDMKKWPVAKKVEDFLLKCDVHKEENLNMYCEDHSQLCCTNCAFLNHRQCKRVELISDLVKKNSTNLKKLSVTIQTILGEMKKLQDMQEAGIRSVESSFDEQLQKIQETRRKINATLDMLEKTTLKEMKDTLTELQASLKSDVQKCASLRDELKQLKEAIQDISDKSKLELSFIASIKCQEKIKQFETYQKKDFDQVKSLIAFQPNSDIEQYLSKLSGLGRIEHTAQTDQVIRLNGKSEYDVSIPSDSDKCCIIAISVLPDRQVLVIDHKNSKVKLLNQHNQVVNHYDVSRWPQDMCQISPCEVAVTVDNQVNTHQVHFIKVINNQVVPDRKLKLQHTCGGIAHHQGDLFVTTGTALYKYTLNGKLVSKLHEDKSDKHTVWSCAVSPTVERLFVTNNSQHMLLTLARDGSVLASFTDPALQWLDHVLVTPAGQVLVCGSVSNTILQIDSKGRRRLATLATKRDGLRDPCTTCYNSNTDSIIVGLVDSNKILIIIVSDICDNK